MRSAPSNRVDGLKVEKPRRPRSVSSHPNEQKTSSNSHLNQKAASSLNGKQSPRQNRRSALSSSDLVSLQSKEHTTIINQQKYLDSPTQRLLIVSSKCKNAAVLEKSVNPYVTVVLYNYDTVSYNSLLALVCASLERNQQVASVACMLTSKPNGIVMVNHNAGLGVLESTTVRSHKHGPGYFFKILFERFVDTKSIHCRLDLVAVGSQPGQYIDQLSKLIGVPVYVSKERFGSDTYVDDFSGGRKVTVGEIYFKPDKLRNWSAGSYQSIELFEKIRMVGKGNFGTAVLYKKKDDNSLVVLKEINMTELNAQERLLAINEAKVLAILNHPNIICYYETFEENGVLMIEMEYADDGTLAQFLNKRDSPVDEKTILSMFAQIVSGITYMHKQNILHRDLKTANIFLTMDGSVKIGDFGVSKVMSSNHKVANTVLGTPYYISPEMCEGKPYNEKSDIWALGCILYEMATRQKTFESTNLPALVNKIINGQIAPIRGDYSSEFRRLVKDMLHKNPEQRPTAEELDTKRIPELRARFGEDEHFHCNPASRGDRKVNEGNRSVLYSYNTSSMSISVVEGLPSKIKIRQVSVGNEHTVVVAMERIVYTWGENTYGQLGHGHLKAVSKPLPVDTLKGKSIVSASCGANFSVFLSDNGIAMTCGDGSHGCLGHGDYNGAIKPRLIDTLLAIDVTTVVCGSCHAVVLGSRGEVYSWGCGAQGRLGLGSEDDVAVPTRVNISQPIRDVRCGHDSTVFITEVGTMLACGNNQFNKLGLNERTGFLSAINHRLKKTEVEFRKTPTVVKSIKRLADVSVGQSHTVVLTDRDHVYVLGSNKEGQMGSGDNKTQSSPYLVKCIKDHEATIVACGNTYTAVGTSSGIVLYWGTRFGQATSHSDNLLQPPASDNLHKRSLSTSSTLSVRSLSSYQQDSSFESASRSPSYVDVSTDDADSGINSTVSTNDSRLPQGVYTPLPILNVRNSAESDEDLSAFLDNIIPFRDSIYILVETNAPLAPQTTVKEKRKKSLKSRLTMQSLKVPYFQQSLSSNDSADNGSPDASDLSAAPAWLKQELDEARKLEAEEPKVHKLRLTKSANTSNWKKTAQASPYNPNFSNSKYSRKASNAKSDSSSDSSAFSQLTVESAKNHRASIDSTRGRRKDGSPRPSPKTRKTNRLHPDRSPVRRTSVGRSPVRSHARLSQELDKLVKEKRETDERLEKMKREHEETIEKLRESHEKEKLEQEQKMRDQIFFLQEELDNFKKRQLEGKKPGGRTESKICSIQ